MLYGTILHDRQANLIAKVANMILIENERKVHGYKVADQACEHSAVISYHTSIVCFVRKGSEGGREKQAMVTKVVE